MIWVNSSRSPSRYDLGRQSVVLADEAVAGLDASSANPFIPGSIMLELQHANQHLRWRIGRNRRVMKQETSFESVR